MPTHWDQLHSYDLVIWGEEEITQVDQLPGMPRSGQILVMIDGGDITKIRYNHNIKPHLLFKRELFQKTQQNIKGAIYPFNFAVEDMYWHEFIPHQARQYDYSCMLRLASNPFRTKLKETLEELTKDDLADDNAEIRMIKNLGNIIDKLAKCGFLKPS